MLMRLPASLSSFLSRGLGNSSVSIVFLSPFPPLRGGIARFSAHLLEALRRDGCRVEVVGFRALWPRFLLHGRLSAASPLGEGPLVLYNPLTWFAVAGELKKNPPDILLAAYWGGFLAPLLFVLRRLSGVRTVALLHNMSSHESFFFEPVMRRLLARTLEGAITLSDTVSREAAAAMPSVPLLPLTHPLYPPEVALPSRESARHELGLCLEDRVLLFFGFVRHYKGLDLLLQALGELQSSFPSVRLVVAGEFYEHPDGYRLLAEGLGISDRVIFLPGFVSAGQTASLFAAADCCVLPYRSATQSGVAQLAKGYGVPLVVTPAGSLPDAVSSRHDGVVAAECTAHAIAEAVTELFMREQEGVVSVSQQGVADEGWREFGSQAGAFLRRLAGGEE
ncbi:MAG TPA: glycosyl transferase family 1 [Chlorobium sp.]|nr:glycosyl transferase family 1 [Chlorobium sp.]